MRKETNRFTLIVGAVSILLVPNQARAQSPADTASVLNALAQKFVAVSRGRIFLYAHMGDPKDFMSTGDAERARQERLTGIVAANNRAIELYRQLRRNPTPEGRAGLYKYLASFRGGYRILTLTFMGNTAAADVSREVFFYKADQTTFTRTLLRFELGKRGTAWEVAKVSVVEVADGLLDQ